MTVRYRIQQWLNKTGSFREGVELLEQGGSSSARKYRSQLGQSFVNPAQKERLRQDLVRLLSQLPEDTDRVMMPQRIAEDLVVKDTPRITALRKKGRSLLKERSDLKGQLLVATLDKPDDFSESERFDLARKIMAENVPALDEVYGQIRRFEEDGIEPADDAELIQQQTVAEMKEIYSLRPQISRLESKKRKGEEVDEQQLEELRARRQELEDKLGL